MEETVYSFDCPVSMALLTDLHNHPFAEIIASLRRFRPQMIMIAGDVVYARHIDDGELIVHTQRNILPFLATCALLAPTFMSLGNHELQLNDRDIALICSTGVTLLDNAWTSVNGLAIGGLTSGMVLAGRAQIQDSSELYPHLEHVDRCALPDLSCLENMPAGYRILLCHHPEYLPMLPRSIDLILSGHAHGGQWRFFNHGVFAPGQGFWPALTTGIHENRMIISRGLSNPSRVPRLFNAPEIVYIVPSQQKRP